MGPETFTPWLMHYGAPALFALLMFGIVGLPVPDETLLVIAGVLIGRGQMRTLPTAVAAAGGAIVGITISYAAGRFAGLPLLMRYGAAWHLDRAHLDRVDQWFDRFGKWLLPVGYFIPGVRHFTAVVAGASELPAMTFAAFAYGGAFVWVGCFLSLGYVLGDRWRVVLADLHRHEVVATVALVALVTLGILVARRRGGTK